MDDLDFSLPDREPRGCGGGRAAYDKSIPQDTKKEKEDPEVGT